MEFLQTVNVQATNDAEIGRKVRQIKSIAAESRAPGEPRPPGETKEDDKPTEQLPSSIPPAPIPYFDIGEATGKPGDIVEVSVEGACLHPMDGFDIGGGVGLIPEGSIDRATLQPRSGGSGYEKFRAVGVNLGAYLTRYLKAQDAIHDEPDHVEDHFWSIFHFADWRLSKALPEEWWRFALGLFSIDQKRLLDPVPIPAGTEIFRLKIKILSNTEPGVYELTCKDEWYYTQSRQRRRDFTYMYSPQGYTKIETFPGKITVL